MYWLPCDLCWAVTAIISLPASVLLAGPDSRFRYAIVVNDSVSKLVRMLLSGMVFLAEDRATINAYRVSML